MCIPNKIPSASGWGVWNGLGVDTTIGFVMFVEPSKYGNALPAFPKEYGF